MPKIIEMFTHWGSWSLFWATKTAHKCSIADISIKPIKETSTTCSLLVCNPFMTLGHEKPFQDESLASHFFDIYVEREKKRKSTTRHIHMSLLSRCTIFSGVSTSEVVSMSFWEQKMEEILSQTFQFAIWQWKLLLQSQQGRWGRRCGPIPNYCINKKNFTMAAWMVSGGRHY